MAHFQAGRFAQALKLIDESLLLYTYMFSLKDKALCLEKLGRHEEARDAIRQLRAAEPSLSLEGIERANTLVFAPEAAQDMNATLRKMWLDPPLASSGT